jgi:carbonic anhydrase
MTSRIEELLRNNRAFVENQLRLDEAHFGKLAEGQHPAILTNGIVGRALQPRAA